MRTLATSQPHVQSGPPMAALELMIRQHANTLAKMAVSLEQDTPKCGSRFAAGSGITSADSRLSACIQSLQVRFGYVSQYGPPNMVVFLLGYL